MRAQSSVTPSGVTAPFNKGGPRRLAFGKPPKEPLPNVGNRREAPPKAMVVGFSAVRR